MKGLLVLLALLVPLAAGAQITFERTYGGPANDYGISAAETDDGGYIITGYTNSFGAGGPDVYLIRTDGAGDTVWTRSYGGSQGDFGYSVEQTGDGGYVIAGYSYSFGAGIADVYLIRTDGEGDTVWTRTYGGSEYEYAQSLAGTDDGGYIVAGYTESFGASNGDVYLIKTDGAGDTVWTRIYGGSESDWAESVGRTEDGGYVIAGSTESFGAGSRAVYLIKTDGAGDTVWTRTYGGPAYDDGNSAAQTDDGGYIIAGRTNSFGMGGYNVYLIKTDGVGDTVWTRTYGGSELDHGYSVTETNDGGYVIAGYTYSFGAGGSDVYLIKTDGVGDTVWTRTYGGPENDHGESVDETDDGGCVIAGNTESFGAGGFDVYLIKTDGDGNVEVSGDHDEIPPSRYLYLPQNCPNPFSSSTTITYSLAAPSRVRLTVYDIRGARLRELVDETAAAGGHRVIWDGRDGRGREVGSGIYFCWLEAGEFSETRRMVLLR